MLLKRISLMACLMFLPFIARAETLVEAARNQVGKTFFYASGYQKINYPMGDIPLIKGVCTDVVVRAYRTAQGKDLQVLIHEDMKHHFGVYPKIWGLKTTDKNIDHRRVPNMQVFFKRHGTELPKDKDFQPGDIVTWNLSDRGNIPHIGVISDRKKGDVPLVIHNVGWGAQEEDFLYSYPITGHYRY